MKEALNNALKHSKCTELKIHFQCTDSNEWMVSITDNGVGFDVDNPTDGNGIGNMKLRANSNNFKVIWNRIEPSGTEMILKCNNPEQVL
jgi:signal transduction histidine kinase